MDPSQYDDLIDQIAEEEAQKEDEEPQEATESEESSEETEEETEEEAEEETEEESEEEPEEGETEEKDEEAAVDDEEKLHEVLLDKEPELVTLAELKRSYQITKTAQKRLQQATETKKVADQLLQDILRDPLGAARKALEETGRFADEDIRNYLLQKAEAFLAPLVEEETLDPTERELRQKRREIDRLEKKRKEEEQRRALEAARDRQNKLFRQTMEEITEALEEAGLDKEDEEILIDVCQELTQSYECDVDLSPRDAVKIVKSKLVKRSDKDIARLRKDQARRAKEALSTKTGKAGIPTSGRSPTTPRTRRGKRPEVIAGSFREIMSRDE